MACLAAVHDGKDPSRLSIFGPVAEEKNVESAIGGIIEIDESERFDHIAEKLKSLVAQEEFLGLGDIHPAWLVEALSKESPRIIGIILRYLPSTQVRYIIEHLPKRIKQRLPQLIDSFAVPAPILKIIRERFERQFISFKMSKEYDQFRFEHLCLLKNTELEVLFRDLGIHEMAMALKGVDRRSLNVLFNRLSIDEARTLQQRIRSLVDVSSPLLKEAKYTVLEMSLSETNPKDLLIDIGLNAFARAFTSDDVEILPILKQKLEPRLGYTLKRYIDEHTNTAVAEICEKRKEIIFGRIEALVKSGSLDGEFANYFFSNGETQEFHLPVSETLNGLPHSGKSHSWQHENGVV